MFGDGVVPGESTAVGLGLHAFQDPSVTEDFEAVRLPIDVADFHQLCRGLDGGQGRLSHRRSGTYCPMPPAYPMQLMVGVFDFPEKSDGTDAEAVPALIVDYVREYQR